MIGVKMNCCGYEHWFPESINRGTLLIDLVDGSCECMFCGNDIPENFAPFRILEPPTGFMGMGTTRRHGRDTPALRAYQETTLDRIRNAVNPPIVGDFADALRYHYPRPQRTMEETDFTVFGARIFVASEDRDRTFRLGADFSIERIQQYSMSDRARGTHRIILSPAQYDYLMQSHHGEAIQRRYDRPDPNEMYGTVIPTGLDMETLRRGAEFMQRSVDYSVMEGVTSTNYRQQIEREWRQLEAIYRGTDVAMEGLQTKTAEKTIEPDINEVSPWLP